MPTNTQIDIDLVNIVAPSGMDDVSTVSSEDSYIVTGGKKQTPANLKTQVTQTSEEIKTSYESNADTNEFTDIEKIKLGNLTLTQSVDLDQLESDVEALNAAGGGGNAFIDDDTFATATATNVASAESIKTYVDTNSSTPVVSTGYDTASNNVIENNTDTLGFSERFITTSYSSGDLGIDVRLQDDDTMAGATATSIASSESIKAYVDANAGGSQSNTNSLFIDAAEGTTTLSLVKDTLYEVQTSFTGNGNNLDLDGTNLTNGNIFSIANNTGIDLDVRAVSGTIAFSEITNPTSSGTLVRMEKNTVREFRVKEAGYGTFHYPVYSPLLDEDDMSSDSAEFAPTQQSVKAYVDANSGGSTAFVKSKIGNTSQAQIHSDPTSAITYNVTSNIGTLTIPAFGDISSATIPIISGTDYTASGDFTLVIKYSDNSVNTWSTGSITDFDLYVPQFKFYDIGSQIAFQTGNMNGLNAQSDAVDPTVEFGNGEVRFVFTNASSWGGFPQMFIQLQFAN
jgi:hypothetical protein